MTLRQAVLNRDKDAALSAVIKIFRRPPKQYAAATSWFKQYDDLITLIVAGDWERLEQMLDGVRDERAYLVKRRYVSDGPTAKQKRNAPARLLGVIDDETGEVVRPSHYDVESRCFDETFDKVMASKISDKAKDLFCFLLMMMGRCRTHPPSNW